MRRRIVVIGAFIISFLLFKPFFGLAYASTYTSFLIYDNQYIQLIANYSGPDPEGFYTYSYTLSYDFILPSNSKYFHYVEENSWVKQLRIYNPYRVEVISLDSPTGWSFNIAENRSYFEWKADHFKYYLYHIQRTSPYSCPYYESLSGFRVKSRGVPGIVKSESWRRSSDKSTGNTVAPTPEPSSIFLLSLGLFGLGSLLRKKYF